MKNIFKKMILAVMTAALVFAAFPVTSAFAQEADPPAKGELTSERLERVWARQLRLYERLGRGFDDIDGHIEKFQERIDKAASNGRDATALQSALDAFESALRETKPIYDSMEEIVDSHNGFDADGKVTDFGHAKSTVGEMGAKLKEVKTSMDGTGRALLEALREFRKPKK